MKYTLNIKKEKFVNHLVSGLIIVIITFLAVRFIQWNYWKIERAVGLAGKIVRAAPAVNLTVWSNGRRNGIPLYQKSFSYNVDGQYYIVNDFDIAPYYNGDGKNLKIAVNNREIGPLQIYRFKTFSVLSDGNRYFVFTTRNCTPLEFFKLKRTMPSILTRLIKLMIQLRVPIYWGVAGGDGYIDDGLLDGFLGFEYTVKGIK
jgi:hypothetical protein